MRAAVGLFALWGVSVCTIFVTDSVPKEHPGAKWLRRHRSRLLSDRFN